jgi:hypothetical protein
MSLGQPRWDATLRPPPRALADGLFALERRCFMPGGVGIPARSFVVRAGGGALAVLSPPPDAEARRDVAALGRVAFLIAPNSFHYVGLASWATAFPEARVFLAPALRARRPELPAGEELVEGTATPFTDALAHAVLRPQRGVSEVAFLHRPSRTLILTDAAFHIRDAPPRDRLAWRLMGVWRHFGPSLTARTLLLRDRAGMADWIERLCRLDFARIELAHGEALDDASPATLRQAFRAYLGS